MVKITAVGDFMPGGILLNDLDFFLKKIPKDLFLKIRSSDIRFCNLECPLFSEESPPENNKTLLHSNSSALTAIKKFNFNIVSLANNHSMDFGWKSLSKTKKFLLEKGVLCIGAGRNLKEARDAVVLRIGEVRVGFLAYSWVPPMFMEGSLAATKESPGVSPYKLSNIKYDVSKLKKKSDFIVISLHWGDEYSFYPRPSQIGDAKKIIGYGADVIIGHHPHVFNGIQTINSKPVFYSLGNFLFSQWRASNNGRMIKYSKGGEIKRWHKFSRTGLLTEIKIPSLRFCLTPIRQNRRYPIIKFFRRKRIYSKIDKLSREYSSEGYPSLFLSRRRNEYLFRKGLAFFSLLETYGLFNLIKKGVTRLR
jgi:poly-gamma-glutamate synthesis protein (capsule biosynthesis protein)